MLLLHSLSLSLSLYDRNRYELNICWNNVVRRLFSLQEVGIGKIFLTESLAVLISHTLLCLEKLILYRHILFTSEGHCVLFNLFATLRHSCCMVVMKCISVGLYEQVMCG